MVDLRGRSFVLQELSKGDGSFLTHFAKMFWAFGVGFDVLF